MSDDDGDICGPCLDCGCTDCCCGDACQHPCCCEQMTYYGDPTQDVRRSGRVAPASGAHCCSCEGSCWHVGGPFYCSLHHPALMVPYVPLPSTTWPYVTWPGYRITYNDNTSG